MSDSDPTGAGQVAEKQGEPRVQNYPYHSTNQKVGGSNPSGRATLTLAPSLDYRTPAFRLILRFGNIWEQNFPLQPLHRLPLPARKHVGVAERSL